MYLYLDESGDLGFDFHNKKPSRFFVITLLICDDKKSSEFVKKMVERTVKNKIHVKNKRRTIDELKGKDTSFGVKTYLFNNMTKNSLWKVCSIVLDKKAVLNKLSQPIDKNRLYNVLSNHLLKQVNFLEAVTVNLFVDRSKNRDGIGEFDSLLSATLGAMLALNVPLNISHVDSHHSYGIQAVDLFCWGVFRKYEFCDERWYSVFKSKIVYEEKFLA